MAKSMLGKGIFVGVLIALASWSVYSLLNQIVRMFLAWLGVENDLIQNVIIVVVIVLILWWVFRAKGFGRKILKA